MRSRFGAAGYASALLVALAARPVPAEAQGLLDKFSIHGYLSQAAGWTSDSLVLLGLQKQVTTDFRRVALQMRFAPSDKDEAIVQLRNRRLGAGQLPSVEGSVALDWGFYRHDFGPVSVSAGRMPMARGIYNAVRDVGIIQPFYRAPYYVYTESFEVIEGASVRGRWNVGGGWEVDATAFGGEFPFLWQSAPTTDDPTGVTSTRGDKTLGGQVWLKTPIRGLRLGGHLMRYNIEDGSLFGAQPHEKGLSWLGSVDGNFDRFLVRGEYMYFSLGDHPYADGRAFSYRSWYLQAGVKPVQKLGIYGQYNWANYYGFGPPVFASWAHVTVPFARDAGVSIKYDATSNLSLKFEGHHNRGRNYESALPPLLDPAQPNKAIDTFTQNYYIASVAVAF
ncbi:MAG TPA: hypothetical protein VG692_07935 [Gemmatimonadales bacterium]|nr:hypothetical protein [Gemmatimonadales bacterium]